MSTLSEGNKISDVVKFEEESNYSREQETILASTPSLEIGSVLGKVTATGKLREINFSGSDGSQNAAAVCLEKVAVDAADVENVLVLDKHSIVSESALVFPSGATTNNKATAIASLEAIGVKVQKGA